MFRRLLLLLPVTAGFAPLARHAPVLRSGGRRHVAALDFEDLTGDGGVRRRTLEASAEELPGLVDRDIIVVDYKGVETASGRPLFAGEELQVVLGDGSMIKGWDVGLVGMVPGGRYEVEVAPAYAYGDVGVPPVLPGGAGIKFEVLVRERKGNSQAVRIFTDMDPLLPRTPERIRESYAARQEERREELEATLGDGPIDKVRRWLGSLYIFGFFSEGAPWYLNPLITFPSIFALVLGTTYLVYVTGAVTLTRESTAVPAIERTRQSSTIDDIEDD